MSFRFAAALSLLLIAGCRSPQLPGFLSRLSGDKDTPSEKEPGRTIVRDQADPKLLGSGAIGQATIDGSGIQLTEFSDAGGTAPGGGAGLVPQGLDGATIVAEVNNTPIFADDVLEPYKGQLALAQEKQNLTPEQLNRLQAKLIRKDLRQHIEKAVLVAALREDLKQEQLDEMDAQVERLFNENEISRLQKLFKVGTRIELERKLEEQGTTLANQQSAFAAREMAMLYIGQKANANVRFGREDLLAVYEQTKQQYYTEPKVRWQQIRINKSRPGGPQEAITVMRNAINDLKQNVDFADVARKYSDGPKADNGGNWDWTTKNSYADKRIDRALFEIPSGSISQPLESDSAYTLVRVIERNEGGYTPFEDVQDAINRKMQAEARTGAATKVIDDLMEQAAIRTIFGETF